MHGGLLRVPRGPARSLATNRLFSANIATAHPAWSRRLPMRHSLRRHLKRFCWRGASSRGLQGLSPKALAFATAPVATAMRFSSYIGEQAITLGLREPEGSP